MKGKGLYIGVGLLIGIGIGLFSSSKITVMNIGHLEKLTITKQNEVQKE